jgi:DNA-directed RNA polymerase specialized sigma24 family protein
MEDMSFEREVIARGRVYQVTATALPDGRTAFCLRSGESGAIELNEISGTIAREDLEMVAHAIKPELAAIAAWHGIVIDENSRSLAERRRRFPNAYAPWTEEQERVLIELHESGMSTSQIAKEMGRRPGAITARLDKLGLS